MRKYCMIAAVFSACFLASNAQSVKKTPAACKFTGVLQGGILEGEADKTYGQFQLLGGIQRNAWFYGLGLGVDYYASKRSVPLFLDVKMDLLKRKNTPFVFADGGYNFSWLRENEKNDNWVTDYKASGGIYYETGVGYKFTLKNHLAFGCSAGYSVKQQQESSRPLIFIDFPTFPQPMDANPPDQYKYTFRRISLKLNCWF